MFEQQDEILFFEETHVMGKPPNHETNPACNTPNPPPWCNPNSTNVDMYLLMILVVVAILIRLNFKSK